MKYPILFIVFILPYLIYSQTYIGGSLSKEFSTVEQEIITPEGIYVIDLSRELYEGSAKRQIPFIVGFRLDHYFSSRIALSLSSEYYSTRLSGYDFEAYLREKHGYETAITHYIRHRGSIRIYPFKRWSVGIGLRYAPNIKGHWITYDGEKIPFINSGEIVKSGTKGWYILSSYAYKNFLFLASYGRSRSFNIHESGISFSLSKMETFNFTLSYRFQILKKPLRLGRKNKVQCAEF